MTTVAKDKLIYYVEEIERQLEAKKDILDTIKSFYDEARSDGFDVKALKNLIKIRKIDAKKREEEEEILTLYMHTIGMLNEDITCLVSNN
jgi:uncharacterized protein (UPF0335 family)